MGSASMAMSTDESRRWDEDGYVHLTGCLDAVQVAGLRDELDRLARAVRDERRAGGEALSDQGEQALRIQNVLAVSGAFDFLIDLPGTFRILLAALGSALRLVGTEVFVRTALDENLLAFHTDGGPAMQRVVPVAGGYALQVKVQFFLTDTEDDTDGQFLCIPGSHRRLPSPEAANPRCFIPEANAWLDRGQRPPGSRSVPARAGDALVFPSSLWHAVGPKTSPGTRETVNFRYGHLWCMPYDHAGHDAAVLARLSPRQVRVLGVLGSGARPADFYKPADQDDVILRPLN